MNAETPRISLEPIAQQQASVLQNLVELYVHDFSEHVPLELKPSGLFEISVGDQWWTDGHYPFFIRCDEKLCGFALVRRGSRLTGATDVMDVAELFVVRGARRRGVGASVVRALFAAFPGKWEIRVRQSNTAAFSFWSRALAHGGAPALTSTPTSMDGVDWKVFRVEPTS